MQTSNGKYEEKRDIFGKLSDAPQAFENVTTTSISMLDAVTYCYNLIGYHDSNIEPVHQYLGHQRWSDTSIYQVSNQHWYVSQYTYRAYDIEVANQ